jgi:maltose alpha-D-glucosyltransferase / alpha-amylase
MEDRFPITDIWAQTPPIGATRQWALFLRNHDELTLEMVTDEERDYMYRAYAQEDRMRLNLGIRRRLAPLLGNNRRAIELNVGLLFSLPGTPVIYYGDEIGQGDNIFLGDRDGVRTPMQWSGDRNAGFSTANPQRLILPLIIDYEYHYQTVNVEAQESNQHSLLWWMRRVIAIRRQFQAFGRGTMEFLQPENPHVIAYIRRYADERVLVVANLSRFVQYVELNLTEFKGGVPIELFGRNSFPPIGDLPYLLTLGPHMFLWFSIESRAAEGSPARSGYKLPSLLAQYSFHGFFTVEARHELERALVSYLPNCRWFRSKALTIKGVKIADLIKVPNSKEDSCLLLLDVSFIDAEKEMYVLPIGVEVEDGAKKIREESPERMIAEASDRHGRTGLLCDASGEPSLAAALLDSMAHQRHFQSEMGELRTTSTTEYRALRGINDKGCDPHVLRGEQSNTSIAFGNQVILKLFRRLDPGMNPDLEVSRFLTKHEFASTAPVAGSIEYFPARGESRTLGLLQKFVPNQGDAWEYTVHELGLYFERVAAHRDSSPVIPSADLSNLIRSDGPNDECRELLGPYLDAAGMMGRRVAELHLALASDSHDPEFAPESYTSLYQRSAYQSMRNLQGSVMRQLNINVERLPEPLREPVRRLAGCQSEINAYFEEFLKQRITVVRMRTHGDLHLGQLLNTGNDFLVIDFEGEPALSLPERRRKRSALRDVAGMVRSFSYAAFAAMNEQLEHGPLSAVDGERMALWARSWQIWASWSFLKAYTVAAANSSFLPKGFDELRVLLSAFQMEKVIYELGYELNNRPHWLHVPLAGIEQLLSLQRPARTPSL